MFELYELNYMLARRPIQVSRAKLCGKAPECVAHITSGCDALTQSKYLSRHDSTLKVLFYEMLLDLGLIEKVPRWYSAAKPNPVYASDDV